MSCKDARQESVAPLYVRSDRLPTVLALSRLRSVESVVEQMSRLWSRGIQGTNRVLARRDGSQSVHWSSWA